MSSYVDPSRFAIAVTPSDSADINGGQLTRGLYIGGAGNISVVIGGNSVTFTGVLAGSILPIRVSRVNATSTTATSIVALF